MKKTIWCLIVLIELLITLNGFAQPGTSINNCVPEPEFNYGNLKRRKCPYSYNKAEFARSATNFDAHFKYQNADGSLGNLKRPSIEVSVDKLKEKFAYIQANMNYHPDSGDIAALVMSFGMDSDKIFVIFQPAVMQPTGRNNQYNWDTTQEHFIVDKDSFKRISMSEFSAFANAYTSPFSKIHINHSSATTYGYKFYANSDPGVFLGDVRSCTMSFQQIFKMYNDNKGNCENPDANHKIKFSIETNLYKRGDKNYKLHVVASYDNLPVSGARSSYEGLSADFSQMSPPNNASLTFPSTNREGRRNRFKKL